MRSRKTVSLRSGEGKRSFSPLGGAGVGWMVDEVSSLLLPLAWLVGLDVLGLDPADASFEALDSILSESSFRRFGYGVVTMDSRNEARRLLSLVSMSDGRMVTLRLSPFPGSGSGEDMVRLMPWDRASLSFGSVLEELTIIGCTELKMLSVGNAFDSSSEIDAYLASLLSASVRTDACGWE